MHAWSTIKNLNPFLWTHSDAAMSMKRPAASTKGRPSSCGDLHGLVDALKPWVDKANFVTYPNVRGIKNKDVQKMKIYLPHLKRIQQVDRTWNFSMKTIDSALQKLNKEGVPLCCHSFPKNGWKVLCFFTGFPFLRIRVLTKSCWTPTVTWWTPICSHGHQELHLVSDAEAFCVDISKGLAIAGDVSARCSGGIELSEVAPEGIWFETIS